MQEILITVALIIAVVIIVRLTFRTGKIKTLDPYKVTMKHIDKMDDGKEFEEYLFRLFKALGYADTYKTVSSRDFGADVVFSDRDGCRYVVQAKRYAVSNPVGLGAVQEVYASIRYYGAEKSLVITSGYFTEACETLAAYNGVKLLDRDDLDEIIRLFKARKNEQAKDIIEEEPYMIHDE
ncbi:restriction endonuclease [Paenibacillus sp. GCM10027626]|uniref:restriction endonuclease n=1 Tax=Paenibacillus sp. GCM10027626 TaxID=3273411 RepID=UPI003637E1A0